MMLGVSKIVPFILVSFLTVPRILTQTYVLVALPFLIKSLNLTKIQSQFFVPSIVLGTLLFLIPAGFLGDRLGPKKMLIWSSYAYTFLLICAAFSPYGNFLLVCLFLIGATTAFSMIQGSTYIADIYPLAYRGRVISIFSTLVSLTFFIGPVLGGLVSLIGQKGIFLCNLPILLIALFFARFLPDVHNEPSKDFKIEYKDFFNRSFISHCFLSLFWQGIISLLIFFPAEFQIHLGLSAVNAGIRFSLLVLPFPIFSPIAGWIFDRLGCRVPYSIGYFSLLTAILFSFYGYNAWALCILAFALAFVLPVSASASWGLFKQENRCSANSIYYFLRFTGSFIGTSVAGYLLMHKNPTMNFFFVNTLVAAFFGILGFPAFIYAWKTSKKNSS